MMVKARALLLLVAGAYIALAAWGSVSAPASTGLSPAWQVSSVAIPTNFKPGDKGHDFYEVLATNTGGASTNGEDIEFTDVIPAGLTIESIRLPLQVGTTETDFASSACTTQAVLGGTLVKCAISESLAGAETPALLEATEHLTLLVHVRVAANAEGDLTNLVKVSGGGAAAAEGTSVNPVSSEDAASGFGEYWSGATDGEGAAVTAAGGHPFQYVTSFAANTQLPEAGAEAAFIPAGGDLKDIEVKLPPGLIGNPTAVTRCTAQQFTSVHHVVINGTNFFPNDCPAGSAVGVIVVRQLEGHIAKSGRGAGGPIYNLVPPKGMPAQLGFSIAGAPVYIDTEVREGDFGVTARLRNTSEAKRISAATTVLWGVPAEAAHNPLRGECDEVGGSCSAEALEPRAFLRLPTSCGAPLMSRMAFDTWATPNVFSSDAFEEGALGGCSQLQFAPSIETALTTEKADSPSGLKVRIHLPQEVEATGPSTADLKEASFTLPEGLVVNPASANGRVACGPEEIGLLTAPGDISPKFSKAEPSCPDASKLGTVEVSTPLVDHPLPGAVYLAAQSRNPFESLLALYIVIEDPETGVTVKLPVQVTPGGESGRMKAVVRENPQLPFEDLTLKFFGGPRAPLRTPPRCGAISASARLTPWSEPEEQSVEASSEMDVNQGPEGGCPTGALAPDLSAGLSDAAAGRMSNFTFRLRRSDGTQELSAVKVTVPPGLVARLKETSYCPEAAIAAAAALVAPGSGAAEASSPSCPVDSAIGTVSVGAGAGPSPVYASGQVYLAGPYKGAPLSFVIVVPALAGPFDLGVVTNRVAVAVDPETAQVSATSDRFPTALAGIPIDLKDIRVELNRPNFVTAPTNCSQREVAATVTGSLGSSATVTSPFRVRGCNSLKFSPRLVLRLRGQTRRGGHPRLRAVLSARSGDANIAKATVTLPHSEFLAQSHLRTICTRVQFAAGACPAGSVYGTAEASSPLLAEPLKGPVYLRSSSHPLPDLVAALHGQIDIDVVGRIDSKHGGIRTSFEGVPDVPVTKFTLTMRGGPKSLLENSRDVCLRPARAVVRFKAQDGKRLRLSPQLRFHCHKGSGR